MITLIGSAIESTNIFIAILIFALLISLSLKRTDGIFPLYATNEMKGLAVLAVVFSHIGYFLVTDHSFLFPLSIIAGVGVDLFLFLSGYGLVMSAIKNNHSIVDFYRNRLVKLFVPLWIILIIFFLLDFFVLNKAYPWQYIVSSFFGFFYSADIYKDINSPLWYFTLILFYYLIFPLVFFKKNPWVSAIIIYAISYVLVHVNIPSISKVVSFYDLHNMAFPIGMVIAGIFSKYSEKIMQFINKIKTSPKLIIQPAYYALIAGLIYVIIYTAYNPEMDKSALVRQSISIITTLAIVFLFLIKKVEFKLFHLLGLYSYEIYLLHWPLLYRYDIFFKFLPGWLAMIVYLILFLGLGWLLQKASKAITK